MRLRHALVAFAAASFALSASAQNLKPGLWEVTNNMKSSSGEMDKAMAQMQQQMASMSPEQRKQMEAAMAKQGIAMGAGPGGMSVRTCMTREMIERNEIPGHKADCRTTRNERSGNTIKVAFSCTNPPSSGEGQLTIQSPEAYSMKMAVKGPPGSKAETMSMDASGKWIAADCGNVKPLRPPAMK